MTTLWYCAGIFSGGSRTYGQYGAGNVQKCFDLNLNLKINSPRLYFL